METGVPSWLVLSEIFSFEVGSSIPFNFLISLSNSLTVILFSIMAWSIFIWSSLESRFNKLLACLSDIWSWRSASWTSSGKDNRRILLAIAAWDFPIVRPNSSCVIESSSSIFWYVLASSIGVRSFLCKFSSSATFEVSLSSKFLIIAGILVSPAIADALYLLSPAIISYLSPIFLTIIGCITPWALIESANSRKACSLNTSRGWKRLGIMSSKYKSTTSLSIN